MKYFLIILAIISAGAFCSCKKTNQQISPIDRGTNDQPAQEPTAFAGEWLNANWETVQIDDGRNILRGEIAIDDAIESDHANDIKLVFLRTRGREDFSYQSLPTSLQTTTGDFQMSAGFSRQLLTISVFPQLTDDGEFFIQPEISDVEKLEYQYIFVPVEIFTKIMIDWTDYHIVQETLHI